MVANRRFPYGLSHAVSTGILFSHFAKTRVTRPYKTRSEKHPNLPPQRSNANSVALPLILSESRSNRKLFRARSPVGGNPVLPEANDDSISSNPVSGPHQIAGAMACSRQLSLVPLM